LSRCGHRPVTCAPARGGLVSPRAIRPLKGEAMYKGSAGVTLPTSIIGSLPRPSWYTAGLGSQSFLEAKINLRYREQYEDAVSVYLRAQETAGLDILTDGDAHFDEQTGGMSWQSYPLTHMAAFLNRLSRVPISWRPALPVATSYTTFWRRECCQRLSGPSARQSAVHSDVEGHAAVHHKTGQIRNHLARIARLRSPTNTTKIRLNAPGP